MVSWAAKYSRGGGTHPPFGTERTTVLIAAFFIFSFLTEEFSEFYICRGLGYQAWDDQGLVVTGALSCASYKSSLVL